MTNNKNLERILKLMAEKKASDVFLSAHMPVLIKIHGQMLQLSNEPLGVSQPRQLLAEMLMPQQLEELEETGELNAGIHLPGVATFRVSAFKQRGSIAAVFRYIPAEIPALDSLNLPEVLGTLAMARRGLVLMVGATGTGKSTTLAAMLDHRNHKQAGHILTIEDPIEFLFTNDKCVVNQREVGRDVQSLQIGLKNAMRQAPDCILIGEIRDRETMSAALSYALSGHLVLSTLHANNSYHALGRILSFYTPEARPALLSDMAAALRAIVSQRLLRTATGSRIPAVEVLLNTQLVTEMIELGNFAGVKEAMERSMAEGSQTFEHDLARLIGEGRITRDEALVHADSPTNLLWRLQNDHAPSKRQPEKEEIADAGPSFTDITLDVHAQDPNKARGAPRRPR
jgi:twitching motility protein PilU